MSCTVSPEFKQLVDNIAQRRQVYLATLGSGSSMLKLTYKGKTLLCVYMRHTTSTITVKTTKEIVAHLWGNATFCWSGPFTEANVKFPLEEVELTSC
jgi:hypothetical protein